MSGWICSKLVTLLPVLLVCPQATEASGEVAAMDAALASGGDDDDA